MPVRVAGILFNFVVAKSTTFLIFVLKFVCFFVVCIRLDFNLARDFLSNIPGGELVSNNKLIILFCLSGVDKIFAFYTFFQTFFEYWALKSLFPYLNVLSISSAFFLDRSL